MIPAHRSPYTLMVAGLLLLAAVVLARRPYYNWDMFPYMAIIMASPGEPFERTHHRVYEAARSAMPQQDFQAISSRQPELRDDPAAFQAALRYHTIKPGYAWLASALYQLGLNPLAATWLPSIISYFFLGQILFGWSRLHGPEPAAALFTFVIALSPPLIDLARYSSPDLLCTLLSTAGIILILTDRIGWGMALLTASVLVRPDAVLLVMPVAAALAWSRRIPTWYSALWALACALLAAWLVSKPGLIQEYLFASANLPERMDLYGSGLVRLTGTYTLPLSLVAVVTLFLRRQPDLLSLLVAAALLSIIIRFLLHPFIEDRFHLPAYLVILLATWETVSERATRTDGTKP